MALKDIEKQREQEAKDDAAFRRSLLLAAGLATAIPLSSLKLRQQRQAKNIPFLAVEYFPLNNLLYLNGSSDNLDKLFPTLIRIEKKNFVQQYNRLLSPEQEGEMRTLPKKLRKFYLKREYLFKKFNQGIKLD